MSSVRDRLADVYEYILCWQDPLIMLGSAVLVSLVMAWISSRPYVTLLGSLARVAGVLVCVPCCFFSIYRVINFLCYNPISRLTGLLFLLWGEYLVFSGLGCPTMFWEISFTTLGTFLALLGIASILAP